MVREPSMMQCTNEGYMYLENVLKLPMGRRLQQNDGLLSDYGTCLGYNNSQIRVSGVSCRD